RALVHVPAVHVVREMVDLRKTGPFQRLRLYRLEIDVIDGVFAVAVDEVDERPANADDGGDIELHRPDAAGMRLGTEIHGALECGRGITHAKRHGAHRRAVSLRETLAEGLRFGIDDEV